MSGHGVVYVWLGDLGALGMRYSSRFKCVDSETFNAYVNYLVYDDKALQALIKLVEYVRRRSLILCREKKPQHCHRQFIADLLMCLGFRVTHIVDNNYIDHEKTSCYDYLRIRCEEIPRK